LISKVDDNGIKLRRCYTRGKKIYGICVPDKRRGRKKKGEKEGGAYNAANGFRQGAGP